MIISLSLIAISIDKNFENENISNIKQKDFLCNKKVYKYYSSDNYLMENSSYKEVLEKRLEKLFLPKVKTISVRFVINCKGNVDGFSVEGFDENYKKISIDRKIKEYIISNVKEIISLPIAIIDKKRVDIIFLLRIKVEDGKVYNIF